MKHYKVKAMDNGGFFVTTKKTFATLQELVSYYMGEWRGELPQATVYTIDPGIDP